MCLFQADVIIWDFAEAKKLVGSSDVMIGPKCFIRRLRQHLGKVEDVGFSPRDNYLCTLGGPDDNAIVGVACIVRVPDN